jgi:LysM repeat protein
MASKKSAETLVAEQAETPVVETVEEPLEAPVEVAPDIVPAVIADPAERPSSVRALPGDSYVSIAERHGVNAYELIELNSHSPISTGTKVLLP